MKRLNLPYGWVWSKFLPVKSIELKCLHKLVLKDNRKNILRKNTFNLIYI